MAEGDQSVQPRPSLANQLADLVAQSQRPRLILYLPNLRVNEIYIPRRGYFDVDFAARIENNGWRDSGAFTVETRVTRNGQPQPPTTTRIDNLAAQTTQDLPLLNIAARDQQGTSVERICLDVFLDPPIANHPAGEVLEIDNFTDNYKIECFDVHFTGP